MRNHYKSLTATFLALLLASVAVAQVDAADPVVELPSVDENLLADAGAFVPAVEDVDPLAIEAPVVEPIAVEDPVVDPALIEEPLTDPAVEEPAAPAPAITIENPAPAVVTPTVSPSQPPTAPPAGAGVEGLEPQIDVLIRAEQLKRRAYRAHLHDTLESGGLAIRESRFEDAIKIYEEASRLIKSIGDRPEDRPEKEAAEAGLAEALYRQSMYLYKRGDLDQAAEYARRSVALGHDLAPELISEIQADLDNPPKPPKVRVLPRWRQPDYREEQAKIADLLKTGREHFAAGELESARLRFETVLSMDPENIEAIRMLQKAGERGMDLASAEMLATRTEMIADVRRNFNPRDYELSAESAEMERVWNPPKQKEVDSDRLRIIKKMEGIRIPEIDFRQANIHDVIDFLQEASVEFDKVEEGGTDEERGVNIILNLAAGQDAAAPAAASVDPFAAVTGDTGGSDEVPLITFSARYISLYEALKIVTDVANLKFRATGSVVMVLRSDAPEGTLIHRMYDVLPSVGEKIEMVAPALRGGNSRPGSRGGGNDFISLDATGVTTARGDWKDFFENLGVGWPRGSSIKYIPAIGKIVVKNTPENLTIFESVLGVLNVVPYQIEIESRFVEAAQDDLNSLGFEWNLTDDWEVAQKKDSGDSYGTTERIEISSGSFSSGLRYATDENSDGTGSLASDNILTVASVLTNPEVEFVLHALEQRGNTDLLSSPKVTTQSGLEATLKVVTEYIYPTAFTVQGISGNNNNNNNNNNSGNVGAVVEPSDFETREVGVILSVLPEVSPEGQMINLTMSPEVVSDPEWFNYGSTYTDADGQIEELNMPQPFFRARSIQTSISIYNGATVVMGGLITESRTTTEDKIPILGDIPIIGRLFQSTTEDSQKRNLLIFVTARLVDPSGRPVKQGGSVAGEAAMDAALLNSDG